MTRILWIGRHAPDEAQVEELEGVFGQVEIVEYNGYVKRIRDVLKKAKEYDVVVTILPTSFDIDFIGSGVFPVKSVRMNGAHVAFRVLTEVSVRSVPLEEYYGWCEVCERTFPKRKLRGGVCEDCREAHREDV